MSDARIGAAPVQPLPTSLLERQLQAASRIAQVLSHSKDLEDTLAQVLATLHEQAGMRHGLVALLNPDRQLLEIAAVHSNSPAVNQASATARYLRGEGIIGSIFKHGSTVVLSRVSGDPRFLDRLALYDFDLPFIGVPLHGSDGSTIGTLAAQPDTCDLDILPTQTRFLELVANLIAQTVRLLVNVEQRHAIAEERDDLRRQARVHFAFDRMVVGRTAGMRRVFDQVRRVAKWNSTVLILGESGTGKELIANAIHYNSPRSNRPLVRLNCAALPESLLESELFGHEKGAFTGAVKQRKGRFEQANGGTLFLDEIGEISPVFQAKLLRILQEGEFERVGGSQTLKVDVRIVTATNKDLEHQVNAGGFREDLYYRLNVMAIRIPPLRERLIDIPELANFIMQQLSEQQGRSLSVTDGAMRQLMTHNWPGNVRELENCLERAAIMSEDGSIDQDLISFSSNAPSLGQPKPLTIAPSLPDISDETLSERERVVAALEQAGWVQAKAARLLGMTPRQIAYRIQTLNIQVRRI